MTSVRLEDNVTLVIWAWYTICISRRAPSIISWSPSTKIQELKSSIQLSSSSFREMHFRYTFVNYKKICINLLFLWSKDISTWAWRASRPSGTWVDALKTTDGSLSTSVWLQKSRRWGFTSMICSTATKSSVSIIITKFRFTLIGAVH